MKKQCILRWALYGLAFMLFLPGTATAADRVVVIPLTKKTSNILVVVSAGQIWMDRNLGAERVAIKGDDPAAVGSLYQWGRRNDGHQALASGTTSTLADSKAPGHSNFILAPSSPNDWLTSPDDTLWQGNSGANIPCPKGFTIPTETQWRTEIDSWAAPTGANAFASPLKLVATSFRNWSDGSYLPSSLEGCYWSSTVDGIRAIILHLNPNITETSPMPRATGCSVRCIKVK